MRYLRPYYPALVSCIGTQLSSASFLSFFEYHILLYFDTYYLYLLSSLLFSFHQIPHFRISFHLPQLPFPTLLFLNILQSFSFYHLFIFLSINLLRFPPYFLSLFTFISSSLLTWLSLTMVLSILRTSCFASLPIGSLQQKAEYSMTIRFKKQNSFVKEK